MAGSSGFINDPPPPPDQRVESVYAWVATHPDGAEGIMSADMDLGPPIGIRHMPLLTSKPHLARLMEGKARQLQRAAMAETGKPVAIELVEYRRVRK
jgi:hypothetical protein